MSTISTTRLFGLSGSGLDIDTIVTNLMKAQRARQDMLKQNKTIAEWKREQYREINNALRSLRDSVSSMRLQGTYQTKTASSSNESIVKVSASGSAVAGSYSIKVTALASSARLNSSEAVSFDSSKTNLQEQLGLTGPDPVVFTINGKEISIDPTTDTIDSLVSKINNAGAGVSASFDKTLSRMFISSTATGAAAAIDFDDVSNAGELFSALKLDDPFTAVSGTDAIFELNGTSLTQATNKFNIAGVTYTLTGTSAAETVSVSVTRDADAIYESIKSFVDLYNSTIDKINSKLTEERDRDYMPLTDDDREKLTDDQEEKWEAKARTGLLRSDSILIGITSKMRSTLYSSVSGEDLVYNSLVNIGITTGNYTEKGKLHIDENKLKEAISNNPDAVMDLFTNSSEVDGEKGLAVRLYDNLNNGIKQITGKAGADNSGSVDASSLGKVITEYDKQIAIWNDRLAVMENRYYKQFTAMEKALYSMNQQSSWLAGIFSAGSGSMQ